MSINKTASLCYFDQPNIQQRSIRFTFLRLMKLLAEFEELVLLLQLCSSTSLGVIYLVS